MTNSLPGQSAGSPAETQALAPRDGHRPQGSEMDREGFDQAWRHFRRLRLRAWLRLRRLRPGVSATAALVTGRFGYGGFGYGVMASAVRLWVTASATRPGLRPRLATAWLRLRSVTAGTAVRLRLPGGLRRVRPGLRVVGVLCAVPGLRRLGLVLVTAGRQRDSLARSDRAGGPLPGPGLRDADRSHARLASRLALLALRDRRRARRPGGAGANRVAPAWPSGVAPGSTPTRCERLGLAREYESAAGIERGQGRRARLRLRGRRAAAGPTCRRGAVVVEHYDPEFVRRYGLGDPDYRKGFEPVNRHGRVMAQIVWAVTGAPPARAEVLPAQRQRPDHAAAGGPVRDRAEGGRHPLQRLVRGGRQRRRPRADQPDRRRGAGRRHPLDQRRRQLRAARLQRAGPRPRDGYLRLRDGSDVAALRFRNRVDENTVTVTLTWNDYRDAGGRRHRQGPRPLRRGLGRPAGRGGGEGPGLGRRGRRARREPQPARARRPGRPARQPRVPPTPTTATASASGAEAGRFTAADRVRVLVTASRDVYMPARGATARRGGRVPRRDRTRGSSTRRPTTRWC